jgi:hypothetical protein
MTKEEQLVEELMNLIFNEIYHSISVSSNGYIDLDTERLREKFTAFVKVSLDNNTTFVV